MRKKQANGIAAPSDLPQIPKGERLRGAERAKIEKKVIDHYVQNPASSIRSICAATGRSYGFIHRILTSNDVPLRERGSRGRKERLTQAAQQQAS